jgi:hypothetical protein
MVKDIFLSSSTTSSLNEANESSEDNNLTAPLISKSATFASTFLANDKFVCFLTSSYLRYFKIRKIFFYMLIQRLIRFLCYTESSIGKKQKIIKGR